MSIPVRIRLLLKKHSLSLSQEDGIYQLFDSSNRVLLQALDLNNIFSFLEDINSIPF